MEKVLQGQELADKLAADHQQSKQFMNYVGGLMEPAYRDWQLMHDISEIEVPEWDEVPAMWRAFMPPEKGAPKYKAAIFNHDTFLKLYINEMRIDRDRFERIWNSSLPLVSAMAANTNLHRVGEGELVFGRAVHRVETVFLGAQDFVRHGKSAQALLGEITLTNIGEGAKEGYLALHQARAKSLVVCHQAFKSLLDDVHMQYFDEVGELSRALDVEDTDVYDRKNGYNPLLHTVMEGAMSVGQAINYLIQPGIEGAENLTVVEQAKNMLKNYLPTRFSSLVVSGDLGPNQMAGLSVSGLLEMVSGEIVFSRDSIEKFCKRQREDKASLQDFEGEDLDIMQRPEVQAVNRREGCPAGKIVRLTSRILLDCLNAETA